MYYVYILQSEKYPEQFYTDYSTNLDLRLKNHNSGKASHTAKFRPWKIIYFSAFTSKRRAIDFEKYLKSASGKAFRNKRLI